MDKKIPIIFLVSHGHSGSTLLDLIFDTHSKIVGVGELCQYFALKHKQGRKFSCTCGKKLTQCHFWQKVFADIVQDQDLRIFRNKADFLLNRNRYFYSRGKQRILVDLKKYLNQLEKIYRNILLYSGKSAVFDSSKSPYLAEALFLSDKLDVLLLHLVRDGRGVVNSYRKSSKEWYQGASLFSLMRQWAIVNLKIELVKKRHAHKHLFIRYEDFVQNPEKNLKKVLNRKGFDYEPSMLEFDKKVHHQACGNVKLRFYRKKDSKIKKDAVWETEMSFSDKLIFNLFFGWLNLFYQKIKR